MIRSVSLVIPAKNAAATLPGCLEAVRPMLGNDGLDELIVVDDGSTDATAALAASFGATVLPGLALGPGAARNVGWRAAKNDLVWFIDADTVPRPDALRLLLPALDDPQVAGAGGSYLNQRPDSLLACLIHEEIVARHARMPSRVAYLATYDVLYRRQCLESVGGFDESLRSAEDVDLSFRLHDAGYRLCFIPGSLVGHHHPTRLFPYLRSQKMHGYNRVFLYLKHYRRAGGDEYSNFLDHLQPPLAMLALASLPLAFAAPWTLPWLALIPAALFLLLLLLQVPLTLRLTRRTGRLWTLAFAPLGFLRAFARGLGMTAAVLRFAVGRR